MTENLENIYPIAGINMAAVSAGIKKHGRLDVVLFELCEGATVAGVYTQNAFCAAPVQVARQHNAEADARYLLINTGNANAGTGKPGLQYARLCCEKLAQTVGVAIAQVLPFSTGVIGEPLPVKKIVKVLPEALVNLQSDQWPEVARGIMTTDTVPKLCSRQIQLEGKTLSVTGIAKGAGMIKPNMATMLGFIFTDAKIDKQTLQDLNKAAADISFNRITVDGDTSTNDCCMLVASGQGEVNFDELSSAGREALERLLHEVYQELAQAIIKDAEGATKFVTIAVSEGKDQAECLRVAYAIAESPLVKTALFASDPNWGRILAAVGRAGVNDLDIAKINISLDEVSIVENGERSPGYTEQAGQGVVSKPAFTISVMLGRGQTSVQTWTCDLSYDYVKINAEYRT
jgi:glutamate N-acetyltransferase/amino-acid N-acetyltransferase